MAHRKFAERLVIGGSAVLGSSFPLNSIGISAQEGFGEHVSRVYWTISEAPIAIGGLMMWCGYHILNRNNESEDPEDPEREEVLESAVIPLDNDHLYSSSDLAA